jgi:hypothetical protein
LARKVEWGIGDNEILSSIVRNISSSFFFYEKELRVATLLLKEKKSILGIAGSGTSTSTCTYLDQPGLLLRLPCTNDRSEKREKHMQYLYITTTVVPVVDGTPYIFTGGMKIFHQVLKIK